MKNTEHDEPEDTLRSLDGIQRAKANPFLYGKVMHRIHRMEAEAGYTGKVIFRFALAAAMIVLLNAAGMYNRVAHRATKHKASIEEFAREYQINQDFFNY
jgi:hypothetical protein